MEEALCRKGIYRRKGIQSAYLSVQRIDRAKRMGGNSANIIKLGMQQLLENFTPTLLEERRTLFSSEGFWFHMELRQ